MIRQHLKGAEDRLHKSKFWILHFFFVKCSFITYFITDMYKEYTLFETDKETDKTGQNIKG